MMWDSLLKLRALPDDFRLYCGHEYTAANIKFALTVEPENPALQARAEQVTKLRAANKPTVPTLLGDEKRPTCSCVRRAVGSASLRMKGRSASEVFANCAERQRTNPEGRIVMVEASSAAIIARLELKPASRRRTLSRDFRDKRVDANGRSVLRPRSIIPAGARRAARTWHRIDAAEIWHYCAGQRADLVDSP